MNSNPKNKLLLSNIHSCWVISLRMTLSTFEYLLFRGWAGKGKHWELFTAIGGPGLPITCALYVTSMGQGFVAFSHECLGNEVGIDVKRNFSTQHVMTETKYYIQEMCLRKSEIAFAIKYQILHGLYRTLPSFCGWRRKTLQFMLMAWSLLKWCRNSWRPSCL